jgi:superfamily II DNA/RNA helicase
MDQRARMATLDAFKSNRLTLLVASDVAARGLDIPDVSHVFNFDIPTHADDYVHRIGRTGRAGRSGTAMTLVSPADQKYLAAIEKLTGDGVTWLNEAQDVAASEEGAAPARGRGRRGEERTERAERKPRSGRSRTSEKLRAEAAGEAEAAPKAEPEVVAVAAAVEAEPAAPVTPAPQPRKVEAERREPEAPRRDRERDRDRDQRGRSDRRGRNDDHDEKVIGLGDHVPQFLLRPVRPPSSSS